MIEWDGEELTPAELTPLMASAAANYGVYTALGVSTEGRVRGLDQHLARLTRDAAELFGRSPDPDLVRASLRRVASSCARPAMLRATVFGPGLHLLVTPRPPSPLPTGGLRVRTVPWVRDLPRVKHIGLFAASLQRARAQAEGYDDALFVTPGGLVAEGPTWNIAVAFGDELVWPDDDCLPGTTRALLRAAVPSTSRPVPVTALRTASAVLATSAGIGVRPVTEIDGRPVPGDPELTASLRKAYETLPGDQLI
jgi:branched-subunit amino acid aminotransferase/4-amino-4-deoxychorismate lyase